MSGTPSSSDQMAASAISVCERGAIDAAHGVAEDQSARLGGGRWSSAPVGKVSFRSRHAPGWISRGRRAAEAHHPRSKLVTPTPFATTGKGSVSSR